MMPHNTVPQTQHLQQQTRIFVTLSSWGWLLLAPGWLAKPQAVRWGAVCSPHLHPRLQAKEAAETRYPHPTADLGAEEGPVTPPT